jgi:hypothetical protein
MARIVDELVEKWKGSEYCFYCGSKMTEADKKNYEPEICCDGYQCGCQGQPTNQPYCVKCSKS